MQSATRTEDLTRKALIRNTALELFARHGHRGVTVRQIADAAGVSPALVIHHFGSKQALVDAVNEHAADTFERTLEALRRGGAEPERVGFEAGSLADAFARALPVDSPLPSYLHRLLIDRDADGMALVRRWYAETSAMLESMTAGGTARPSDDPAVRAAFFLVNDLAMLVLRDVIAEILEVDPLSDDGLRRWTAVAIDVYTDGVFTSPDERREDA